MLGDSVLMASAAHGDPAVYTQVRAGAMAYAWRLRPVPVG